jgi:hypothetical protein
MVCEGVMLMQQARHPHRGSRLSPWFSSFMLWGTIGVVALVILTLMWRIATGTM